jgi:hypothetical protein
MCYMQICSVRSFDSSDSLLSIDRLAAVNSKRCNGFRNLQERPKRLRNKYTILIGRLTLW